MTSMSAILPTCSLILLDNCSCQGLKSFVRGTGEGMNLKDVSSSKKFKNERETTMKEKLVIEVESLWNEDHDNNSRSLLPHPYAHTCETRMLPHLAPWSRMLLELKPGLSSSQ